MADSSRLMRRIGLQVLEKTQELIEGGPGHTAANSIHLENVTPTSFEIVAHSPATYLIEGWKEASMSWLDGKTVSFISKYTGHLITRRVTPAARAKVYTSGPKKGQKAWVRPARAPHDVFYEALSDPHIQGTLENVASLFASSVDTTIHSSSRPDSDFLWSFWPTTPES